ncbi:hypothetical protein AAVH_24037 [Aphelenchoides avenae]|nr:hypothetical protein AAVH_24037 [Aphelenchus avenae]
MFLVENDDRPTRKGKKKRFWNAPYELQRVNWKWITIYDLYMGAKFTPPLDYLKSFELALVLKVEVGDADVRDIFAHRKPLVFWGCPRLLVSRIIEAFGELHREPAYLDVTITALSRFAPLGSRGSSKVWPQVYKTHLPCYACTTVKAVSRTVDFVIEKFHISSENFGKRLTVELHYQLEEGPSKAEREPYSWIHEIVIRLTDKACFSKARLPAIASRSSSTPLLLPEFASDVFCFLERAHFGSSLLANSKLHGLLGQLKQRLPVHHLKCVLEKELLGRGHAKWPSGNYWLEVRHIQRDVSYTAVRRFKLPSTDGAENDCALIRHYLSNSYVADLRVPDAPDAYLSPFAIKMLASLATRNFSVGHIELCAESQRLTDYRSMDAVFIGMPMSELHLTCYERSFVELVKTTDFFRMSSLQRLRQLRLTLNPAWMFEDEPRSRPRSKSPLWVSGICLLRNCEYYRVDYGCERHFRSIERKMVRICEEFERGEITDTVEHFHFKEDSQKGMNFKFNRDNLIVSGMKVEGTDDRNPFTDIEWDVYRFRSASTGGYLTACVGRNASDGTILHIVRGEVFPNASFADYADDS